MAPDIEEILVRELSGLCRSCILYDGCVYRVHAKKVVIQCEVFESNGVATQINNGLARTKGLCLNCSKLHVCNLPKEASGVWHCEEYE